MPDGFNQPNAEEVDGSGMSAADRRHVDNLSVDQLDARIRGEHPGLAHAVVVRYGPPMALGGVFGSRGHDLAHGDSQFSLSSVNRAPGIFGSLGHGSLIKAPTQLTLRAPCAQCRGRYNS